MLIETGSLRVLESFESWGVLLSGKFGLFCDELCSDKGDILGLFLNNL